MLTTTTGRSMTFIQIVVSKSGGEPHVVRGFEGVITCDCKAFEFRGKCSHQAIGQQQEAREQVNWDGWQAYEAELGDPEFDGVRELLDSGPVEFDAVTPAERKAAGRKAFSELFGQEAA